MASAFGFGPRGSGFESRRGLGIFSAVEDVSTRTEARVPRYVVVSPLVRQFQPTPAGSSHTITNHNGVAGFPPAIILVSVR